MQRVEREPARSLADRIRWILQELSYSKPTLDHAREIIQKLPDILYYLDLLQLEMRALSDRQISNILHGRNKDDNGCDSASEMGYKTDLKKAQEDCKKLLEALEPFAIYGKEGAQYWGHTQDDAIYVSVKLVHLRVCDFKRAVSVHQALTSGDEG